MVVIALLLFVIVCELAAIYDRQNNEDGSICAHVPVSWLRISPPRQYTEEQRQQMGERLRQNRSENTATQG